MRVIYNGVDMMALETHYFSGETVLDDAGVDYLYTRYVVSVRAIVSGLVQVTSGPLGTRAPGPVMSYDFGQGGPTAVPTGPPPTRAAPARVAPAAAPVTVPGGTGLSNAGGVGLRPIVITPVPTPVTHATVRHRLTTPRGQLYVFAGPGMESGVPLPGTPLPPAPGPLFLQSPNVGFGVDCKNGPIPRAFAVANSANDQTLIVDWTGETFINENAENFITPRSGLLSNRFRQQHVVDADGFTTIRTQGSAIYRTDLVYALPFTPDADRPILFMPVPLGFQRENIVVSARQDVTGVDYAYDDAQVKVNFVGGPFAKAAHISVNHRQAVTANADVAGNTLAAYERYLNLRVQKRFAAEGDGDGTPMLAKGPGGRNPAFVPPGGGGVP